MSEAPEQTENGGPRGLPSARAQAALDKALRRGWGPDLFADEVARRVPETERP